MLQRGDVFSDERYRSFSCYHELDRRCGEIFPETAGFYSSQQNAEFESLNLNQYRCRYDSDLYKNMQFDACTTYDNDRYQKSQCAYTNQRILTKSTDLWQGNTQFTLIGSPLCKNINNAGSSRNITILPNLSKPNSTYLFYKFDYIL